MGIKTYEDATAGADGVSRSAVEAVRFWGIPGEEWMALGSMFVFSLWVRL
jgi:hypothetical protein